MKVKTKFEFCIHVKDTKVCWESGEVFEVLKTKTSKYGTTLYVVQKDGIAFELASYEVNIV